MRSYQLFSISITLLGIPAVACTGSPPPVKSTATVAQKVEVMRDCAVVMSSAPADPNATATPCACQDPVTGDVVTCPSTPPMPPPPTCPSDNDGADLTDVVDTVAYSGPLPPNALYSSCREINPCDVTAGVANFLLRPDGMAFVAEVAGPGQLTVYNIPAGSAIVRAPSGNPLLSIYAVGAGFADPAKRVIINGIEYRLDFQNDCLPIQSTSGPACICSGC